MVKDVEPEKAVSGFVDIQWAIRNYYKDVGFAIRPNMSDEDKKEKIKQLKLDLLEEIEAIVDQIEGD